MPDQAEASQLFPIDSIEMATLTSFRIALQILPDLQLTASNTAANTAYSPAQASHRNLNFLCFVRCNITGLYLSRCRTATQPMPYTKPDEPCQCGALVIHARYIHFFLATSQ
jgi:hypothetical protein